MLINCKGKLVDLASPKIMGILNLTPDSFYDGGKYKTPKDILAQTEKMLKEGATFIDIGAYSSRPGAEHISEEEELRRLLSTVKLITAEFPEILISIDTFRSKVAEELIEAGAAIINDISSGNLDENMFSVIANHQVPYIMMHMKGTPQNMQENTYYQNIMEEMLFYFSVKTKKAKEMGIHDVIVDPGFGFSKKGKQNFDVLQQLSLLKQLDCPILVGLSRKSMIYNTLECSAQDALNGTSVLNTIALLNGANLLRVHDVKEAKECVTLLDAFKK